MSGPKVVRIVTEEQKIAICETQMALLSTAIQSLLHYVESHAINDEKLESKLREKLQHYTKLATPDNYRKIPGMIQRELDYISSEFNRMQHEVLQQARSRQTKIRNVSESIKTLQMLASTTGTDIDPIVRLKYSDLSDKSDAELYEIEQKIASELSMISFVRQQAREETQLTAEQKEIQHRLIMTEDEVSVSEWKLISAELDKGNDKNNRIDTVMAELDEIEFPDDRKKKYQTQLDHIYEENSNQQRALLLDSLLIDLAEQSRAYKRIQKARHDLAMIKAQLETLKDKSAIRLSLQIDKTLESENISVIESMLEAATIKMHEIITARSVEQGREALIKALKSLGYSVSEGMETAVVENGHLVVKKPAEEVYGVEVQTIAAVGKFQLRIVSGLPDTERSRKDDVAEEERWCDDLEILRKSLVGLNVDLEIEKALQPGAVAVRHSSIMTKMIERDSRVIPTGARELDR